jgi:Autophagocytosis associated protein, active-site domain
MILPLRRMTLCQEFLLAVKASHSLLRFKFRHSTSQCMTAVRIPEMTKKITLKRVNADGSPLVLEEIMNTNLWRHCALPETQVTSFALVQPDALFPLLSQGDHPTLGTPSWFIHPCGTANTMGELIGAKNAEGIPEVVSDESLDWLEMWFMVLGNIVEL